MSDMNVNMSVKFYRCCSTLEDVTKTKGCAIYKIYDEKVVRKEK